MNKHRLSRPSANTAHQARSWDSPPSLVSQAKSIASKINLQELEAAGLNRHRDDYFLNISYPSLQAMPRVSQSDVYDGLVSNDLPRNIALYVHVPFCSQMCAYCHYYKTFRAKEAAVDHFLDSIACEFSHVRERLGKTRVQSIYIGGGTPSYLNERQIRRLFDDLRGKFTIRESAEISFEVHPENASCALFSCLANVGVNRVSIGVESFEDHVLKGENRRHSKEQAINTFRQCSDAGIENINLDFIYGLRGQTLAGWAETLREVGSLRPASFCAYYLRLKKGTAEYNRYLQNPHEFPSENDLLLMHVMTFEAMHGFGYTQTTVDWFIREGRFFHDYQDHNWQKTDSVELVGTGPSAYSYVNGFQYYNVNDLSEYTKRCEAGELPIWKGERLGSMEERMRRSIVLGIKSKIDRRFFQQTYGVDITDAFPLVLKSLKELGMLTISDGAVELTYNGMLFADEVGRKFYSEEVKKRMAAIDANLISTTLPHLNR